MVIEQMAQAGAEPTYCMGDDIPLPVLSDKPHPLFGYFKQRFAQACPPSSPLACPCRARHLPPLNLSESCDLQYCSLVQLSTDRGPHVRGYSILADAWAAARR